MARFFRNTPAALVLLLVSALSAAAQATHKAPAGTLVLVFKDGHRQTFDLADIARMEFPPAEQASAALPPMPSRAHYLGRWEVGEGNGETFLITLRDNGSALRSLGEVRGTWRYVDGEAQIRWEDGSQDAIRRIGSDFRKCWYRQGRSFSETPDNVTPARNLTQNPAGID